MIEFPRLLYRAPGPHKRPGGTFDHICVQDADEAAELLAGGWHPTLPDAIDASAYQPEPTLPATPNFPSASDDEPPTREELLTKAAEIGIEVDRRWGNRTLAEKVAKAMKGK